MNFRKPLFTLLTGGALLFTAVTCAQEAPPPPPPGNMTQPAAPMPAAPSQMPQQTDTVQMQTPQGELTVHSTMPPPPPAGPAPSFEQLSGGGKWISEAQAAAYPLLANDFIYADHNRDHRISKREYKNWLSQK